MKKINSYETVMKDELGIRLNGNENFNNISERALEDVLEEIRTYTFNRYPDTDSTKLREIYGRIVGVDKENIIAGNGSDEMLSLIINSYINKGKKALTIDPDFSMYDFYVTCNEGKLIKFETEDDGSFSLRKFIYFGKKAMPNLILLSNPNNPTGHVLNNKQIEDILISFPEAVVVIDEAYYEFYGNSALSLIEKYENLIITRTLSKAWGLASLRVGFLISNINRVKELNKYKVPYNLNQISQNIACKVLSYPEKTLKSVEQIVFERERLYKSLKDIEYKNTMKFSVFPSRANFIYGRTTELKGIKAELENKGIVIRYFDGGKFRISVGAPWENDMLVNSIKCTLCYEEVNNDSEKGAS